MTTLRTERLDLIPASAETLALLVAEEFGRAGQTLGVVIPDGWPHEPEAIAGLAWHLRAVQHDSSAYIWRVRLLVLRAERRVIGSINLKGPPEADGTRTVSSGRISASRLTMLHAVLTAHSDAAAVVI